MMRLRFILYLVVLISLFTATQALAKPSDIGPYSIFGHCLSIYNANHFYSVSEENRWILVPNLGISYTYQFGASRRHSVLIEAEFNHVEYPSSSDKYSFGDIRRREFSMFSAYWGYQVFQREKLFLNTLLGANFRIGRESFVAADLGWELLLTGRSYRDPGLSTGFQCVYAPVEKIGLQGAVRFTQVVYRYDSGREAIPEYNVPEDKGTPKAFVSVQIGVGFFFGRNTDGIIER